MCFNDVRMKYLFLIVVICAVVYFCNFYNSLVCHFPVITVYAASILHVCHC